MTIQFLDAVPLTTLSGVGAAISDKLGRIGIHNLQDLLFHLPIRYEDRTRITPIHDLRPDAYATIEGVVQTCEVQFGKRPIFKCFSFGWHIKNYATFFLTSMRA